MEDSSPGISDDLKTKMGLYLVKSLVEDFHGKVWAEDRVRGDSIKGAKFIVRLPVAE